MTSNITDNWTVYLMDGDVSFLHGSGDLAGTLLQLNHAPFNNYFGFQVGFMANDANCNYGASHWFTWQGNLNGSEISVSTGSLWFDLSGCSIQNNSLGCTESGACNYDPLCGHR